MNYLVDTKGRWWRWPSELLAERLGYPDPDFDLAAYAARNLGYVWLEVREDVTLLQFRAGMLTRACVDSLRPYLRKAATGRPVGLVYFASGWLEEAFVDVDPLLARIDELATLREPRMRDLFIRKPHDILSGNHNGDASLTSLFDVWRFADAKYSDAVRRYLHSSGLVERTVMIEPGHDGELYVNTTGGGFTIYDKFRMNSTVGRRVSDQPDKMYGSWVESSYRHCLHSGQPAFDDVDAIIEEPNHDARRRRYQRLILRWRLPGGKFMLSGSSRINVNLAIPLSVGMSPDDA